MGRPTKPKDEKLTATIIAKVLPAERKEMANKAKAENMSLSAWIRKRCTD